MGCVTLLVGRHTLIHYPAFSTLSPQTWILNGTFFQSGSHSFIQALFALSVCVKRHTLRTLTDALESNVLAQSVMWAECYFSLFSDDSLLTSYIDSKLLKRRFCSRLQVWLNRYTITAHWPISLENSTTSPGGAMLWLPVLRRGNQHYLHFASCGL